LASALANLIELNVGIITLIYTYDRPWATTNTYCKMRNYLLNASQQMSRFFIVTACFDRFALCSANVYLRKFCQVHIARRYVIPTITIFYLLIQFPFPIYVTSLNNSCVLQAPPAVQTYQSFYSIIAIGIIPPALALIFSVLTFHNLKLRQKRRQGTVVINQISVNNENRDKQIFVMLLIQIFVYVISTTPYTIYIIYNLITTYNGTNKSAEQKLIEAFVSYTLQVLRFFYPFSSFYLFLLISNIFRKEFKLMILLIYHRSCRLWMQHNRNEGGNVVIRKTISNRIAPELQKEIPATIPAISI
jgi:hypothetical protein